MNRVKILDVTHLNADDMENLVNDTFHSNMNGHIGTITIEYSDVD